MIINNVINDIKNNASGAYIPFYEKTLNINENGYGKGDIVLGCKTPTLRNIAKKYFDIISIDMVEQLLHSQYHEIRLVTLLIMVLKFEKYNNHQKEIVDIYLSNTMYINNWDLVDLSCYKIIGKYFKQNDDIFQRLSRSTLLWDNRIAIVSTYAFIRENFFDLTLELSTYFCEHEHHLIHKACGWMLREVGKRDENILLNFLKEQKSRMPKIMMRYACEKIHISKINNNI